MHPIDWIIMLVPFAAVLGLAIYARKYARDVVDFLAAGRVAGRYVISVGDVARPWPKAWWGKYYYVTDLIVPMVVGCISTVWFLWGGIRDGIRLFKDLDACVIDADDNGFVRHE